MPSKTLLYLPPKAFLAAIWLVQGTVQSTVARAIDWIYTSSTTPEQHPLRLQWSLQRHVLHLY